ncbi:MAG: hypothetical protein NVS3B10_26500 [Polyangiales bacterium]
MIDAMVITPRIVGRSVGLAPLEVILTMMAAGSLFGFLGVLLAVPLGAVAKILVQRAVKAYLASEFYSRSALAVAAAARTETARSEAVTLTSSSPPSASAVSSSPTPLRGEAARAVAKGKL